MKSLYERENLQRGDIILCCGEERIFIAYIEGARHPYICVYDGYEDNFKNNRSFSIANWAEESVSAKPKEWYEDIPKEGVVCWVSDENKDEKRTVDLIMYKDSRPFFYSEGYCWAYATPVKPEECYKGK